MAIAHAIEDSAPAVEGLDESGLALAQRIADTLANAENPLIVSGTGCFSQAVLKAAANVTLALAGQGGIGGSHFYPCLPESNSMGSALLQGGSLKAALQQVSSGEVDTVVVLENDLSRRVSRDELESLFDSSAQLVMLDHHRHASAEEADMVLPVGTFAETEGTLVSSEGRAQRHFAVYLPKDDIRASWEWLSDMIALREGLEGPRWQALDEVTQSCAAAIPELQAIVDAAPGDDFRISGQKINRQPHRYSGRTAMNAAVNVCEPKQPQDPDSAFGFTMEGYAIAKPGERPAAVTPYYWTPGWNSNQSVGKFQQEINGPLAGGDPGVRLLEPVDSPSLKWTELRPPSTTTSGQWLLLPQQLIFASEELSAKSQPVTERSPVPCVLLNPGDAETLTVTTGDGLVIECADRTVELEVKIEPSSPSGCICVPVGIEQAAGLVYLQTVEVKKALDWQRRPEADVFATTKTGGQS